MSSDSTRPKEVHAGTFHQVGLESDKERKSTRSYKKKLQALEKAIARGDSDAVKSLLEMVDVNDECCNGATPLEHAVAKNRDDMVQLILTYDITEEKLYIPFTFVLKNINQFNWTTVEKFLCTNVHSTLLKRFFCGAKKKDKEIAQRLMNSICTIGSDTIKAILIYSLFAANKYTNHNGTPSCTCVTDMNHLIQVFSKGLDPMVYLDFKKDKYKIRYLTGCSVCHKRHPLCTVCETSRDVLPSAQCMSFMVCVATASNSRYVYKWALDYMDNPQVLVPQASTRGIDADYSEYWNVAVLLMRCGERPTTELWTSLFYWDTIPKRFTVKRNKMSLQPRSLPEMCRLSIRRNIFGPNMVWCLERIHYPQKLKQYLMFRNEDYVTLLCEGQTEDRYLGE